MDSSDQEEWVKKLEQKLCELRQQRIKVDEANETLRKKLETFTAQLDELDGKYGKMETSPTAEESTNSTDENDISKSPLQNDAAVTDEKEPASEPPKELKPTEESESEPKNELKPTEMLENGPNEELKKD